MAELLGLENILPYVELAALVIGGALALIAAAAFTYIVQTTDKPLLVVMQWLVGYMPGERPREIARGVSYGARMVFWAGLIGLVGWIFFH